MRGKGRASGRRAGIAIATVMILIAACGSAAVNGGGVGSPAPDFTLPERGGGVVCLADFEG